LPIVNSTEEWAAILKDPWMSNTTANFKISRTLRFGIILTLTLLITVTTSGVLATEDDRHPAQPLAETLSSPFDPSRGYSRSLDQEPAFIEPQTAADLSEFSRIFYPDEREQVTETSSFPWSAIAHIEMYVDGQRTGTCTGTLIGPDTVITAGHCLYTRLDGWADAIAVSPGRDGNATPYGRIWASDLWAPSTWVMTEDPYWDWGILRLPDQSLGQQTGWFQIGVLDREDLETPDFRPVVSGYPGDKPFGTMWTDSQAAFDGVTTSHLFYQIDTFSGQSGASVRRERDNVVVGIHIGAISNANVATRIDHEVLADIKAGCAQLGCQLSYFIEETPPVPEPSPTPEPAPTPPSLPEPPPGEPGSTYPIESPNFEQTWSRTDGPITHGLIERTWMWGPAPFTPMLTEPYAESPDGQRIVQYFDKSRMEITQPDSDSSSIWYVTNGLLVLELITGQRQIGDELVEQFPPAEIAVAGDLDDPDAPTYASFTSLIGEPSHDVGAVITDTVDRDGHVTLNPALSMFEVRTVHRVPETGMTIAEPFWEFMNSEGPVYEEEQLSTGALFQNPFYATGFPITEPYWANVRVDGESQTVLVQIFERRVLTYAPTNPEGWQVEAGNVGIHYFLWRYVIEPQ
jgi:V8-like Glu-specific endopeptidase